MMTWLHAIVLAVVEGITEYLPISSTGHMIIASSLLGIHKEEFTKLFEVAIQLGAILAAVVLYWRRFMDFRRWQFYTKLLIAVLPAIALGAVFSKKIDALLESPTTVAITLLVGGVLLLFVDKLFANGSIEREEDLTHLHALKIGAWQCLAMIPGVSRSGASILGGMQQELTRRFAAEFSFFLAVPTMCAATGYKMLKGYSAFTSEHIKLLLVGNLVAFVVAMLAIKLFITFLQKHGFRWFGWYRILVGSVLLLLILLGVIEG